MTTLKPLVELQVGDFVHDMHVGIGPLRQRFGIVSHITGTGNWFPDFPNRQLRVVGHSYGGLDALGHETGALTEVDGVAMQPVCIICGYHDGPRSGVMVLAEYVTGPDPRD